MRTPPPSTLSPIRCRLQAPISTNPCLSSATVSRPRQIAGNERFRTTPSQPDLCIDPTIASLCQSSRASRRCQMDADTQIDLAKEEVPAEQAWDSPLQHTTTHLSVPRSLDADPRPPSSRSSRGAHASTYQVRLKPRSKSPAEQLSHHQSRRTGQADFDSFDEKDIGQGQHVVQLPPVDGGFGAWSYVYAAFSMYIVVWGASNLSALGSDLKLSLTREWHHRLSIRVPDFPNSFLHRSRCQIQRLHHSSTASPRAARHRRGPAISVLA